MSLRESIGRLLGPGKPLVVWGLSQLILRWHGVDANFKVDVYSKQPSLSFGSNVVVSAGTEIGGGTIIVSEGVSIGQDSVLRGEVEIGRGTNFVKENRIVGDVSIGNYCAFASGASVQQQDHEISRASMQGKFYGRHGLPELSSTGDSVAIGNDVWLGLDATVVSGVAVEDGAVIGANALVSRDVEPFEIVGGNPAEHLGWRFPEPIREELLEQEWWEWSQDRIRRNEEFFSANLTKITVEEFRDLVVQ